MAAVGSLDRRISAATAEEDVDLDALSRPILTRRKDFIDKDEEARKSPNRVLYFRRNADYDRLIEACGRKLRDNPRNLRALLIRASSYSRRWVGGETGSAGATLRALRSPCRRYYVLLLLPLLPLLLHPASASSLSLTAPQPNPPKKTGCLQQALDDYNSVLKLEPRSVDALYHRGAAFEKLGSLDDAIRDFTAVLTLDPNHVKAGYARGACRNLKGEFFEAIGARYRRDGGRSSCELWQRTGTPAS